MIIRHGRAVSQGKQGLFWGGASGGLPSPPPAGALSPAGSGDAAQWAASITDRRGSGDQALNGAHWAPAPPKGGGETWSSASLWRAALSVLANASPPPPKGEARLGLLQASGGLPSPSSLTRVHLPQRGGKTWPSASLWWAALSAPCGGTSPKGEARLGLLQASGGLLTRLPLRGRYVPVGRCPAAGLRCRVGR